MKIAIIADPLDNQKAGVYVYTKALVEALCKKETPHDYILIRQKFDPDLKEIKQIVVPNINLPIGFASFRLFIIIPLIAWWHKVDVVMEPAHFGPFNLPKNIFRITMIHDLTPILFPKFHRWHSQFLQRIFLAGILKRSHLILTNSLHTAKDVEKIYPFTKEKVHPILLGRDTHFQRVSTMEALSEYKIDDPYFLFVSTIEPRKQLIDLLEAYCIFRNKYPDKVIKLVIVGQKGWKSDHFYLTVNQHPFVKDIILTGFVKKSYLPEFYSHCIATVYPSIYEGFGFPVLEALSCGAPVICSNNSSLPEVGGTLAYYFTTNNINELADRMAEVWEKGMQEDYSQMAVTWVKTFSWEKYASEFEKTVERKFRTFLANKN